MIVERIDAAADDLRTQWQSTAPIRHLVLDDLLPEELASQVIAALPPLDDLLLRSSLRERKRVGIEVDRYEPIIREMLYAFQQPEIVDAVQRVTGIEGLVADPSLYAAGLSVMAQDDFLNPHIDNSHDGDQKLYRALNLLYYVTPDWVESNGGNLELWDRKVTSSTTVLSAFNRLVVMETTPTSWHSVKKVSVDRTRCCVSNYFFAAVSPTGHDYRHITTFTGRPEEKLKRATLLVLDRGILSTAAKVMPSLVTRTKHRIKTDADAVSTAGEADA